MDLGLSEQQEMLKQSGREFLESECPTSLVREMEESEKGYSPELWRRMAEVDWLGILFPPQYGGAGGSLVDQVALSEEIGRAILPSPMLTSTVLSGLTILNGGSGEQKARLLPQMARGETIVTLALAEPGGWLDGAPMDVHAVADDGDYVINGTKLFVPYAHVASHLLCVTRTSGGITSSEAPSDSQGGKWNGVTLFLVDPGSSGVTIALMESTAGYKQHEVRFQDVRVPRENMVGKLDRGWGPLEEAKEWATVVQCAEMVGRAEKVLEMVVDYSKVRVAFGRPIGNFQAVQHRCADLRVAVDGARVVTYQAAWKLAEGIPCPEDVSMAKAFVGSASRLAAETGHAVFAGISFTMEHDMQLYTMRSKIAEANLGDTDFHLDRVSEHMARSASRI